MKLSHAGLLGLALCASLGQAAPPLAALHADAALPRPVIDGRLDDEAWRRAPVFDGFRVFRPESRADAGAWRTQVQLLIERDALVFALRAQDPAPATIRDPLLRRDEVWPDQDSVTVWLDASGRQQVAQYVRVNAAGVIADGLYTAATDDEDATPDFLEVEAAVQRTAEGYTVEIRWPLIHLRYAREGGLPWRIAFTRRVPEAGVALTSTARERTDAHALRDMHTVPALQAAQSGWAQASHLRLRAEGTVRDTRDGAGGDAQANLGLALQWRPRADWVIDGLLRPDFSQVELDAPQLSGNTRFALFQPEKRAFFLESADLVGQRGPDDWGVARGLAAFYSRTVAAPRGGLRASWRGASNEATALWMRDGAGGTVLRASAYATDSADITEPSRLLFARARLGLGAAALAPLVSLRDWGDGRRTQVAGVDGLWTVDAENQLGGHWLASAHSTALDADARLRRAPQQHDHNAWLHWRHRGAHWKWNAHWESIGPEFINDNGFVPQAGIRRATLEMAYALHPQADEASVFPLYEWEWTLRLLDVRTLRDARRGVPAGEVAQQGLFPGVFLLGPLDTEIWAHANWERLRVGSGGALHAPRSFSWGIGTHPGPALAFVEVEGQVGEFVDFDADRLTRGASWSAFLHYRQRVLGWGLLAELRWRQTALRAAQGDAQALVEGSQQLKLVLLPSAAQALRLVHQRTQFERRAETRLMAERQREQVTTLTWLAREGPLRHWSLGASWSRPGERGRTRRELYLKWEEGWAL